MSLPELPTSPSLWEQLGINDILEVRGNIADNAWTEQARDFSPEIVLHLAAQPLVSVGYDEPAMTFDANVAGTVQVMSLVSGLKDLLATLIITTDKVYDPRQGAPHSEAHYLGGLDPYAASKAAAELVVLSWPATAAPRATARAGNVIGGGDWAALRLLPDLVRAWNSGETVTLRRPRGVRPWQHVLEPLRGYLAYVEALATGRDVPSALNFGPADRQSVPVEDVVRYAAEVWANLGGTLPERSWEVASEPQFDETAELTLDSRLAADRLGWESVLDWREAVTLTLEWYRSLHTGEYARDLVATQLRTYSETILEASA